MAEWSEAMSVGHRAIDEQHRQLIALVNMLTATIATASSDDAGADERIAALTAEFPGHGFHGDMASVDIIRTDVGVAGGFSDLVHKHNRDARGLGAIDRRGAGFKFAGIQDDHIDLLRDEILHLTDLLLSIGLGVDHHEAHAGFRLGVFHDGFRKFGGVFRREVTGREADEDLAGLAGVGFLAARKPADEGE